MKKFFYAIIFIMLVVAIFNYAERFANKSRQVLNDLKSQPVISEMQKQVITSGPLRGTVDRADAYLTRTGVIIYTNQQRQNQGLSSLKENQILNQAAQAKVKDMFQGQYFEHISPIGRGPADLAKDAGYEYIMIGENLALGNYKNDQDLVQAWMNSPGHRANILNNKYTEIGVAVGKGMFEGKQTWLAVQEFGRPLSDCPQVDESLKAQIDSQKSEIQNLESQLKTIKAFLDQNEPSTKKEVEDYNKQVADYNALVKIYNNKIDVLKQTTDRYNLQVRAYNECLK
ncbi:MAG: CAP domain-containing protein [Candidatus Doudnabacteria bacterium]|nr:CAP domain-containing protein [Candidatus Doudnabacteria bacterium]